MLGFERFYWGTTKKIIVAVGSIFDNVEIDGDHGDTLRVPLYYSPREKFIDNREQNPDIDSTAYDIIYPAIGFEITGFNFAPERHTNPLRRIENGDRAMSFNRVPYDVSFNVYIGARRFEESLRIVEQVLPFFSPEITMTYMDRETFQLESNLTVVLDSVSHDMEYEGSYDQRRTILWTLQLTAKAYYYTPVQNRERISKTIIEMRDLDFSRKFETYTSTVNPRDALKSEPHTIVDETIEGDA